MLLSPGNGGPDVSFLVKDDGTLTVQSSCTSYLHFKAFLGFLSLNKHLCSSSEPELLHVSDPICGLHGQDIRL